MLEGAHDADDIAWLRGGFARAFRDGLPLDLALGLPATRARLRTALRDYWLAQAADELSALLPWPRACELARRGREFERRTWPVWRRHDAPPGHATALDRCLFYLHRHGGRVPNARRLFDVLAIATPASDIAVKAA
jgi:hypothetical protein